MDETQHKTPPQISVGDQVELRKPHPCGSRRWIVYRIGADIGLRCTACDRRVMLTRSDLAKQMKRLIRSTEVGSEDKT